MGPVPDAAEYPLFDPSGKKREGEDDQGQGQEPPGAEQADGGGRERQENRGDRKRVRKLHQDERKNQAPCERTERFDVKDGAAGALLHLLRDEHDQGREKEPDEKTYGKREQGRQHKLGTE